MVKKGTKGQIILFNGTSSAGKSAILKEFEKLQNNYTILKIDDWFPTQLKQQAQTLGWLESSGQDPWLFLYEYLYKKTGEYYFNTQAREALFNDSPQFFQIAKNLALEGQNVIIDTVLEYEKEYKIFFDFFKGYQPVTILVYCPLDILLQRVEQRNTMGIATEQRTSFQSFEQFPAIFKIQEHASEPVVDRIKSSVIKDALQNSINDLIMNNIPKPYLPKLEEFKKSFIQQFKLNEQETIMLTPKHRYSLILQGGKKSPYELAKELQHYLSNHTISENLRDN